MGRVSGVEAAAIGCNWSFAPIVDINRNWRNPIISTRTWSEDVEQTLELSLEYMRGIRKAVLLLRLNISQGMVELIKRSTFNHLFAPNQITQKKMSGINIW